MKTIMKRSLPVIAMLLLTSISAMSGDVEVEDPLELKKQQVKLSNGVRLEYVERGNKSGTCIIFLHGYTDSWRSFEHVITKFPKEFHVIAISQRGHGDSDRPETGYHPSDFADDLAQFMLKENLGPCIIVGHSLGGLVVQQFAMDYPELTKAVVIESSAPSFADNPGVPEFLDVVMKLTDPVSRDFAEEFQRSTIAQPVPAENVKVYVDETGKVPARVWTAIAQELMKINYLNELQKIKVPVLVLWGDKDTMCLQQDQDQFMQGLSSPTLKIYEGTGHAIHWENPARFVEDVTAFVRKL